MKDRLLERAREFASQDSFFGDLSDLVTVRLSDHAATVQREVVGRIARARERFRERYADLEAGERETVFKALASGSPEGYEFQRYPCPACGQDAVVNGEVAVDWQSESWGERPSPVVDLQVEYLGCSFCGLELASRDELRAASVEMTLPVEDIDPSDFYDPYDEDDRY